MTPTWEDGTEPLVGGGLVQAGKVDRQVLAALAAAKEVQSDPPKIGCVGHDCAECKKREDDLAHEFSRGYKAGFNAGIHAALTCYSPDDSAQDWADKMKGRMK